MSNFRSLGTGSVELGKRQPRQKPNSRAPMTSSHSVSQPASQPNYGPPTPYRQGHQTQDSLQISYPFLCWLTDVRRTGCSTTQYYSNSPSRPARKATGHNHPTPQRHTPFHPLPKMLRRPNKGGVCDAMLQSNLIALSGKSQSAISQHNHRIDMKTHPYILLTNAYAARNPTVPVSKPYTQHAIKL